MIKDYACERAYWINLWKRNPSSLCVSQKNIQNMRAVEHLSEELVEEFGVSLATVSTQAAKKYLVFRDKCDDNKIQMKVLKKIVWTLENMTNPFTNVKFSQFTITESLMDRILLHESGYMKTRGRRRYF